MGFNNLKTDKTIKEPGDYLGGNYVVDSGIYPVKIGLAYIGISKYKAMSLNLIFKGADNISIKQVLWMTSGEAKGCLNYYLDKNGDKNYLPGFNQANALALLTTGKEIGDLDTEEKVVNVYSPDAKKEIPTKVDVFTDLLDQDIVLGVIKQVVDKTAKGADDKYHPTGETREENEINKIFRASDNMTVTEIRAKVDKAEFITKWEAKWKDQVKMKAKGADTSNTGTSGTPTAGAAATAPQKSLFS